MQTIEYLPAHPVWKIPTIIELSHLIEYDKVRLGKAELHSNIFPNEVTKAIWSCSTNGASIWILTKKEDKTIAAQEIFFTLPADKCHIIYVTSTESYLWWSQYLPQDTYENAQDGLKLDNINWNFRTRKLTL